MTKNLKFWLKFQILRKKNNFGQKCKCSQKILILAINENVGQEILFRQKSFENRRVKIFHGSKFQKKAKSYFSTNKFNSNFFRIVYFSSSKFNFKFLFNFFCRNLKSYFTDMSHWNIISFCSTPCSGTNCIIPTLQSFQRYPIFP